MKWSTGSAVLALVCLVGCGGEDEWAAKRPKVYRTSGTVLLDGKPLDEATVVFHSTAHNVSATGTSDKDGRFTLTTFKEGDGAAEGAQKVVVTKRIYIEKKTRYDSPDEPSIAKIPQDLLPLKYAHPSMTDAMLRSGMRWGEGLDYRAAGPLDASRWRWHPAVGLRWRERRLGAGG